MLLVLLSKRMAGESNSEMQQSEAIRWNILSCLRQDKVDGYFDSDINPDYKWIHYVTGIISVWSWSMIAPVRVLVRDSIIMCLAPYMLLHVRASVRPSVARMHFISQKRSKLRLCNFHHAVAHPSSFGDKFHPEILTGSSERGRQTRVVWGKQVVF